MIRPVVILHGWGLSGGTYRALIGALEKKRITAFAVDFPKDETKPYVLSDYVDFLRRYVQKHSIRNPVLLGHSFGGRVALQYQSRHPVRALILTGTPGFTPFVKKIFILFAKAGKLFFNFAGIRNSYYWLSGARDYLRAQGAMKQTFKNVVGEDLAGYMKAVRVPTLLVWGANDRITPVWIAEKMRKTIANAKLIVIAGADHGVSYKKPKEFVGAIYDFLQSLS